MALYTNGHDALEAISNQEPLNWAFIGPDPEKMPLVASGEGGHEEMLGCYCGLAKEHASVYGLLRLEFETEEGVSISRWIFVRASAGGSRMSVVKHGREQAQTGAMEKTFGEVAQIVVSIQVTSEEEFALDDIIARLVKASPQHREEITVQSYETTLQARKAKSRGNPMQRTVTKMRRSFTTVQRQERAADLIRCESAPDVAAALPSGEDDGDDGFDETPVPAASQTSAVAQSAVTFQPPTSPGEGRGTVKSPCGTWTRGQPVLAMSTAAKKWVDDGLIVDILAAITKVDGDDFPPGTIKVRYAENKSWRLLVPGEEKPFIKASERPAAPRSITGELFVSITSGASSIQKRCYCVVSDGHMQWWASQADSKQSGATRIGTAMLLEAQLKRTGTCFWVKPSEANGILHSFDATTDESATAWHDKVDEHIAYLKVLMKYRADEEKKGDQSAAALATAATNAEAAAAAKSKPAADRGGAALKKCVTRAAAASAMSGTVGKKKDAKVGRASTKAAKLGRAATKGDRRASKSGR